MSTSATSVINLTPRAAQHIENFIKSRGHGIGLRFGTRPSGCSGLTYDLEYVDQAQPDDLKFESQGVTIFIDPASLSYLQGTELDFVHEGLNAKFQFNNPNAQAECGCGKSFSV